MNILHTESMGVEGGQTRRVVEELKIAKEAGCGAYLLCRDGTWLQRYARDEGIEVLTAPLANPLDIYSTYEIVKIVKDYDIDIVHSHDSKDGYPALYAAMICKKPYIRSRHNDLTKKPGLVYRLADATVTTGSKIRSELISHGIDGERIVSLPSYPQRERFSPDSGRRERMRRSYGVEGKLVIGTLSGLNERKRPHLPLEAVASLAESNPDIVYLVAGPEGKERYRESFFAQVERLGLQERVKYLGFVEAEEFLDAIDIYICSSRKEGIPQAVMQSMMMGCAVVASDVGSVRDLDVERNIAIFEPESVHELSRKLREIVEDGEYRARLSRLNEKLAAERFNRDILAGELISLYERVLRERA
jgi:glycosyltransferase involved in cell wall biosynthesis